MAKAPSPNAHWRDSARSIRFFIWDGDAAFPMVLFLMHIRLWTFILAVSVMMFFTFLNRYGFSLIVFLRWLRSFIAGSRKIAIPWWMR
jgi:intracellular multiplication protein IcmT